MRITRLEVEVELSEDEAGFPTGRGDLIRYGRQVLLQAMRGLNPTVFEVRQVAPRATTGTGSYRVVITGSEPTAPPPAPPNEDPEFVP